MRLLYLPTIITVFIIIHASAMDLPLSVKNSIYEIPSLQETTIESIATGYGTTQNERKKNGIRLIAALQNNHANGTSLIDSDILEKCKNRYMGLYGWKTYTENKPAILLKQQHDLYTSHIIPYNRKQDLYIINNGTQENDLAIVNIKTGNIEKMNKAKGSGISAYGMATNTPLVIYSTWSDTPIKIWNTQTNEILRFLKNDFVFHIASTHDTVFHIASTDDLFATTDSQNVLKIWDIESGSRQLVYPIGSRTLEESAECLVMNNKCVYVGREDGYIFYCDIRSPKWNTQNLHKSCISIITFSQKDPFQFYSGSSNNTIKKWDLRTMKTPLNGLIIGNDPKPRNCERDTIRNIYARFCERNFI